MALFRPTNITPSSFPGLGSGTVDITKPLKVSWQVNGTSPLVAYQIVIQQNDTASTQVYSSGKIALTAPFYGTDFEGNTVFFSVDIPVKSLTALSNGYANGYKLLITQWWTENDSIVQVQPAFFLTRSEPTLTIPEIPKPLPYRKYTFSSTYAQAQGDALSWFRWRIAPLGREDELLFDSGPISGCGDVKVQYDGFFSGQDCMIRCECETENGQTADTGWIEFTVSYGLSELNGFLFACSIPKLGAIKVSWPLVQYILGTASGNYTISTDHILDLPSGSSVTFDAVNKASMNFANPWNVAWKGRVASGNVIAWTATGDGHTLSLGFTASSIYLEEDGVRIFERNCSRSSDDWWTVLVASNTVYVRWDYYAGGLYPAETLYPSDSLYPVPSDIRTSIFRSAMDLTWFNMAGIKIFGKQSCRYLWVLKGDAGSDIITSLMQNSGFAPEFGNDTYLLANFLHGLNAGNLLAPDGTISGLALYRKKKGQDSLRHITDLQLGVTEILDYGYQNQQEYVYYLFPMGENTFLSTPLISEPVTPVFWDWTILKCTKEKDGAYHLDTAYRFSCNLSTGAVSNNNAPEALVNFTRYPKRQPVSTNYKSGSLTALIGKVDMENNVYTDSAVLADDLMDLSTDDSPKFLRDRKGNFLMIETDSAVTMQVGDVQYPQPYTMVLPWRETGSASDVSVIQVPSDDGWPL